MVENDISRINRELDVKMVFVSYTQCDRGIAYEIVDYLEKSGLHCFIAPRDIDPGKAYAASLTQAMNKCDAAVLVTSNAINDSEHVMNEVDVLFGKKKKIIPFFVEDCELNDEFRYYLGRKQWINAFPDAASTYFPKLLETIDPNLSFKSTPSIAPSPEDQGSQKTIFEYKPDRGVMINPEDHQRNVSFRSDTLLNLLSTIYKNVTEKVDEESSFQIFHDAGYEGGHGFGERMNEQWRNAGAPIEAKLRKWCEFDSKVGWGKFSIDVTIDENEGTLEGKLRISENFAVDKKNHCKTCAFMMGYCEGVIEALLEGVPVELECVECPMKNRLKSACVFSIRLKEE